MEGAFIVVGDIVAQYQSEAFHGETMRVEMTAVDFSKYGFDLQFRLREKETGRGVALGKIGLVTHASSIAPMPIIVSSIFLTVYVTVWYSALSRAPATLVSSVLVFAPVVTAIFGGLVLHKPVGQQGPTLMLLTIGTILVIFERIRPVKQHEKV